VIQTNHLSLGPKPSRLETPPSIGIDEDIANHGEYNILYRGMHNTGGCLNYSEVRGTDQCELIQ